jgi:hypothetical protein
MGIDGDRRQFLARLLASAAATGAVGGSALALPAAHQARAGRYLERMLQGLELGEPFFDFWCLEDAYAPRAGAVILHLRPEGGELVRVDICRRGKEVLAPAATQELELFVMDGGDGNRLYPEDMKLALQLLGDILQDNTSAHGLAWPLLTHRERLRHFPEAMERAAVELVPTVVD